MDRTTKKGTTGEAKLLRLLRGSWYTRGEKTSKEDWAQLGGGRVVCGGQSNADWLSVQQRNGKTGQGSAAGGTTKVPQGQRG